MGNQTLGRGELWFSRFKPNTQVPEGFRLFGNCPEFNLTIETEMLDHYSSMRGIREKDKSVPLETTRTGSFTCDDIQLDNLAYFFFGSKSKVTQTSATAQTETFIGVVPGYSYQIGLSNLTPTGVKSLANVAVTVGGSAKAANVDYLIDLELGILTIVEGGTIASGATVTVTYDRGAKTFDQVISGTLPIEGTLRFISYNPEGPKLDYFFPYVKLSPNGDMSLIGDEWLTTPFNVEILNATGKNAIYIDGRPYTAS